MYPAVALAGERRRRCKPKKNLCQVSQPLLLSLLPVRRPVPPLIPVPPDTPPSFISIAPIQGVGPAVWVAPETMIATLITIEPFSPDNVVQIYTVEVAVAGTITLPVSSIGSGTVVLGIIVNINNNQRIVQLSPEVLGAVDLTTGTIGFDFVASLTGIQILPDDNVTFHLIVEGTTQTDSISFALNPGGTILAFV